VDMAQLIQDLAVDIQASVLAAWPPAPWSAFIDVEDHMLRSLPPSQDYQACSHTALLRSTFPLLLRNFTETDAVKLIWLGLRDSHAIDCAKFGLAKTCINDASHPNPVDAVYRMAADISGCFRSARDLVCRFQPDTVNQANTASQNSFTEEAKDRSMWSFRNATLGAAAVAFILCSIAFFKRRQKW
jgi:hypothetical protein